MKSSAIRWGGAFAATGLGAALFIVLRVPQEYTAWTHKQAEIRQMQRKVADLARDNEQKRQRLQELERNPSVQEMEIRERLKMLRKNEKQFILQDQNAAEQRP